MAKFQTKAFTGAKPLTLPNPDARGTWHVIDVEFPATSPAPNDLIELFELPIGVKCLDYTFNFPDIDSNGTPLLAFSIGTENAGGTDLGTVWESGLTAGRSTSLVRAALNTSAADDITTARQVAIKVTAAAATYAGATKVGQFLALLQG